MSPDRFQARRRGGPVLLLAVGMGLATLALWTHATLPRGDDVAEHVQFVRGFAEGLREGWLYPRWLGAANLGFGAPAFVFYPPLGMALAAGLLLAGLPLFSSLRLGILLLTAGGALAGAALGRHLAGGDGRAGPARWGAALAGALLVTLPYHAVDTYTRFALAELGTFMFLPFFFRALDTPSAGQLALPLSFAGLCVTHLPTAYLAVLIGTIWTAARSRRRLPAYLLSIALGTACAAVYVLPAVTERGDVHADWLESNPVYRFDHHWLFSPAHVDVSDDPIHGPARQTVALPTLPVVRRGLLVTMLLAAVAWTLRRTHLPREPPDPLRPYAILIVLCAVFMTRLADPVWRFVPGLASVAFPWRLGLFLTLATAIIVADTLVRLSVAHRTGARLVLGATLSLALAVSWHTGQNTDWTTFTRAHADLPGVRQRVAGSFMPRSNPVMRGFAARLPVATPRLTATTGGSSNGRVRTLSHANHRRVYDIVTPTGGRLNAALFDFPVWEARIDGVLVDHQVSTADGTVSVPVAPGHHLVEWRFRNPPLRRAAAWISIASLLTLSALTVVSANRTMRRGRAA
ncbi:MAG: hypothetical protein ACE5IK_09690 [Acidobacteriota bacterium]